LKLENEALGMVSEYFSRQRLAQIGFYDDLSTLDSFSAECFLIISNEIDKLNKEGSKRKQHA